MPQTSSSSPAHLSSPGTWAPECISEAWKKVTELGLIGWGVGRETKMGPSSRANKTSYPPCRGYHSPLGIPFLAPPLALSSLSHLLSSPSRSLCCECHDCSLCQEKAFHALLMWHLFGNMRERALKINLEMASYKFGFPVLAIYRAHIVAHCLMHKYDFFVSWWWDLYQRGSNIHFMNSASAIMSHFMYNWRKMSFPLFALT